MTPGILTPSSTRALLERLNHHPKKQLGQNFLIDGNIVRKSLELASITAGDRVIEIGPGLGTLTSALLAAGAEVFAIERDPVLVGHLRGSLGETGPERLHLIEGDAVEQPLAGFPRSDAETGEFKIVANLPYAISSPWMEGVLSRPLPAGMVLMLQLEAAQRYAAAPGTKSFGAISVFLQAAYEFGRGHRVARSCFYPVPEVDSTLLQLRRRQQPGVFSESGRRLVRELFQQRRKQVLSLLRQRAPETAQRWAQKLEARGIRCDARAEDVPVSAWIDLDRLLAEK